MRIGRSARQWVYWASYLLGQGRSLASAAFVIFFIRSFIQYCDEKTVKYFSAELKLQDEYLSSIAYSLHQRRHNKMGILKKKTLI